MCLLLCDGGDLLLSVALELSKMASQLLALVQVLPDVPDSVALLTDLSGDDSSSGSHQKSSEWNTGPHSPMHTDHHKHRPA